MPSTMIVALLVFFQAVDAADHRRFAGAGRAGDDDALAAHDLQVDVAQHVEIAVPLVHVDDFDRDIRGGNGQFLRLGFSHDFFPQFLSFVAGVEMAFHEA